MATHSSNLAWKIQGQRSLAGYGPWGHRIGHDWVTDIPDRLLFWAPFHTNNIYRKFRLLQIPSVSTRVWRGPNLLLLKCDACPKSQQACRDSKFSVPCWIFKLYTVSNVPFLKLSLWNNCSQCQHTLVSKQGISSRIGGWGPGGSINHWKLPAEAESQQGGLERSQDKPSRPGPRVSSFWVRKNQRRQSPTWPEQQNQGKCAFFIMREERKSWVHDQPPEEVSLKSSDARDPGMPTLHQVLLDGPE